MADTPSPPPASAPAAAAVMDPYRSYNFRLDIQGVTKGYFTECTGLGIKVQSIAYREAGSGQVVRRLPGPVDYSSVTLKYGLVDATELWDWFMSGVRGNVQRKHLSVVMFKDEQDGKPGVQWDLVNAWVSEWNGAPLDALGREAAVETMTLVFESLERV
ncbi:MAG: phage tail protein [Verrucomicrobium sp.]|nr:phage tail protein [Verrucomicrobium sp.]